MVVAYDVSERPVRRRRNPVAAEVAARVEADVRGRAGELNALRMWVGRRSIAGSRCGYARGLLPGCTCCGLFDFFEGVALEADEGTSTVIRSGMSSSVIYTANGKDERGD